MCYYTIGETKKIYNVCCRNTVIGNLISAFKFIYTHDLIVNSQLCCA